jgi:hypothetical protein
MQKYLEKVRLKRRLNQAGLSDIRQSEPSPRRQARKIARNKAIRRIIRFPRRMLWALLMEGVETRQMVHTYIRQGKGKLLVRMEHQVPSEEELQQAREQLMDIPKFLPFFVFVVVPLPGVTEGYALMAMTLENWMGQRFSLLPSQIRKVFEKEEEA